MSKSVRHIYVSESTFDLINELRTRLGYKTNSAVVKDALVLLAREGNVLSNVKVPVSDDSIITGEDYEIG